ncbi:MAG: FAD-dependent oxidoreductase [Streptosporangiales bacterium]
MESLDADTTCCVVGGGPGGMVLAYLLARAGVRTTLLESRGDFDRDFRGDSLHPATLELLDSLGLVDDLLRLEHYKARYFQFHTGDQTLTTTDYGLLRSRFPYVALMPQGRFLDFMAERAEQLPTFQLATGARVDGLVEQDGRVTGVRLRQPVAGNQEISANLVVGADGRFSTVRRLAGMPAEPLGASSDVLWFELPRYPETDPPDADVSLYFGAGHYAALLGKTTSWQVGYTIAKGSYAAARSAGVASVRDFVSTQIPWLADRTHLLSDWSQLTLLSVEIARVDRWHRPGLLLIGDAAHIISPVGGNGILMAVQDAVAATNTLATPLRDRGNVTDADLASVQQEREPAITRVQRQQVRIERRTGARLATGRPFTLPAAFSALTRTSLLRKRSARSNAYGPKTPLLDTSLLLPKG